VDRIMLLHSNFQNIEKNILVSVEIRTKNKIKNDLIIMIFWKKYGKNMITLHWKYNNSDKFTLHVDFDFILS
jgi:hypothetical protein